MYTVHLYMYMSELHTEKFGRGGGKIQLSEKACGKLYGHLGGLRKFLFLDCRISHLVHS